MQGWICGPQPKMPAQWLEPGTAPEALAMGVGPAPAGLAGGAGWHQDMLSAAQISPSVAPRCSGTD